MGAAAVAVGRLPELDVLARERLDLARRVDDAGARRACADVDADVVGARVLGREVSELGSRWVSGGVWRVGRY